MTALAIASLVVAAAGGGDSAIEEYEGWREPQRCGVNVAYAFLKLTGKDASYSEVANDIPVVPDRGSSIGDLVKCISANGIPVIATRAKLADLRELSMPIIAHLELDDLDSRGPSQVGHFVLVASIDDDNVRYLDGTLGIYKEVSTEEFIQKWSGFIITRTSARHWHFGFVGFAAGALLCLALKACKQVAISYYRNER